MQPCLFISVFGLYFFYLFNSSNTTAIISDSLGSDAELIEEIDSIIESAYEESLKGDFSNYYTALDLSKSINYIEGEIECLLNLSDEFSFSGDLQKAEEYVLKAKQKADSIKDVNHLSFIYYQLSFIKFHQLEYLSALDYGIQSLEYADKLGDPEEIVHNYSNFGFFLVHFELYDQARIACNRALSQALKSEDRFLILDSYLCLFNCRNVNADVKKEDLDLINKVISLSEKELGDPQIFTMYVQGMVNKAMLYNDLGRFEEALSTLDKIPQDENTIDDAWHYALIESEYGRSNKELGRNNVAIEHFEKSLSQYDEGVELSKRIEILQLLGESHRALNQGLISADYFQKASTLRDRIKIENQKIEVVKKIYEEKLPFIKPEEDNRPSYFLLYFIIASLALATSVSLFYLYRKKIEKAHSFGNTSSELNIQPSTHELKSKLIENIQELADQNVGLEAFVKYFEKSDSKFLDKLREESNSLTSNEIRLASFVKLGLNNKEIAQLLNVQPSSVNIARYRLKQKLKLKNQTLFEFLNSLN